MPGTDETGGKRKHRGRKPDADPSADQKIAEAWATGQHKKFADLDTAMGLDEGEAKLAVDRHRHRKPVRKCRNNSAL